MRVTVDARQAAFPERTGVGTYVWHLLRELPAADPSTLYAAWYLAARDAAVRVRGGRPAARFPSAPNLRERSTPIPSRAFAAVARRLGLPRVEWFAPCDVLFAPNFVPPPTRRPFVVTVHDLAFRLLPQTAPLGTRRWLSRFEAEVPRAARIIVVSEQTRRDLLEVVPVDPARIRVIPHGVDHELHRPATAAEIDPPEQDHLLRSLGVDGPYLLTLGAIEPRKNLPRLVHAFAALPPTYDLRLVLAGGASSWNPEGRRELEAALRAIPQEARRRIVLTGHVSDRQKVHLLQSAVALVLPSVAEGFGLPVLEAMACGTPVLTSDASALPEVAGDAAVLVDPFDVEAIRAGIERIAGDENLRRGLRERGLRRAAGFNWQETAERTARVLHEAVSAP